LYLSAFVSFYGRDEAGARVMATSARVVAERLPDRLRLRQLGMPTELGCR